MLHRPCARNRAHASILLARAAAERELSEAERAACSDLVEALEHTSIGLPGTTRTARKPAQ
jgi:hypothetical protein